MYPWHLVMVSPLFVSIFIFYFLCVCLSEFHSKCRDAKNILFSFVCRYIGIYKLCIRVGLFFVDTIRFFWPMKNKIHFKIINFTLNFDIKKNCFWWQLSQSLDNNSGGNRAVIQKYTGAADSVHCRYYSMHSQ